MPTKYFIQLGDHKGGLTYLKWFSKNFPDDSGFPDFLFEWTIILFKCGKTKDIEKKAFETFCANTYLLDKLFGKSITPVDKWEGSNIAVADFTDYFDYSSKQPELVDFAEWLNGLINREDFKNRCDKYIEIQKKLKTENDPKARSYLIMQARQLEDKM